MLRLLLYSLILGSSHSVFAIEIENVHLGGSMRGTYTVAQEADTSEFDIPSVLLFTGATISDPLSVDLNFNYNDANGVRVMDAFLNYEFNPTLNIRAGRHLPPSDRANISGVDFMGAWYYPTTVAINNILPVNAGREEGVTLWGLLHGERFKYQIGLFNGRPLTNDGKLFSGTLRYAFWDTEPGYFHSSTYYGEKDILSVGVTLQTQPDAAEDQGLYGDYTGLFIDLLLEKRIAKQVYTLEGAYYDYDYEQRDPLRQGEGYMILAAVFFPNAENTGFRPIARYQRFNGLAATNERLDVELSYIFKGHSFRGTLVYSDIKNESVANEKLLTLGIQAQF